MSRTAFQLFVWPHFRSSWQYFRHAVSNAWFILRGGMKPGSSRKKRSIV